jgi:hypothetical protein
MPDLRTLPDAESKRALVSPHAFAETRRRVDRRRRRRRVAAGAVGLGVLVPIVVAAVWLGVGIPIAHPPGRNSFTFGPAVAVPNCPANRSLLDMRERSRSI